ncbi:MAG: hypothetical protein VX152_02405, partial [Pseudomonadota bacterium]|nr:hypothetical protein [Pseudomonadota bacterium]
MVMKPNMAKLPASCNARLAFPGVAKLSSPVRTAGIRAVHYVPLMEFPMTQDINRVVLAYSGGLDTSVILKWL